MWHWMGFALPGTTHIAGQPDVYASAGIHHSSITACYRQQVFNGTDHQVRTIELNVVPTPIGDDPFARGRECGQLTLQLLPGVLIFLQDCGCDRGTRRDTVRIAVACTEDDQRD